MKVVNANGLAVFRHHVLELAKGRLSAAFCRQLLAWRNATDRPVGRAT